MLKKEKIHFDDMTSNLLWVVLLIISIILVLIGLTGFFTDENSKWNSKILFLGSLLQSIYFLKDVWYKNYIRYNKLGMVIKIHSFWGKSINYQELKDIELTDNKFVILRHENDDLVFNISTIQKNDIVKLYNILKNKIDEKDTL